MFIPAYLIQHSQRYIKNYEKISHMLTMGLTAWVLFSGGAMAYEEPEYKILQSNDAYEFVNIKTGWRFKPFRVKAAVRRFADYFCIFRATMKPLRKFQ